MKYGLVIFYKREDEDTVSRLILGCYYNQEKKKKDQNTVCSISGESGISVTPAHCSRESVRAVLKTC